MKLNIYYILLYIIFYPKMSSNAFCRHIHRELCSISNELNTIFGLQMLMQTIVFQLFTIQLIYEFYKYDLVTINDTSTYSAINFLNTYFWATVIIVKMIVFNYICEELCTKVHIFIQNAITIKKL